MRKWIGFVCVILLLVSLCACGEKPEQEPEREQPGISQGPEATKAPVQMAETVIVEDENCAFTVTGVYENAHTGLELSVVCENKTDKILMFTWVNTSVCGFMYDPVWAEEVQPGEKAESVIYFDTYALEELGVSSVDEIAFGLYVYDSEDFMAEPLVDEMFTIYPTGMNANTVSYPARRPVEGETVLLDNEVMTFVVEKAYAMEKLEDEFGEAYRIRCYVNNKTDKDLLVAWEGISVGGNEVNAYWSMVVAAGRQGYGDVVFYHFNLEEAGLTEMAEIDFTLTASDYNDWRADYLVATEIAFQP